MKRPAGSGRKEDRRRGEPSAKRKVRVRGVSAKNPPEAAKRFPPATAPPPRASRRGVGGTPNSRRQVPSVPSSKRRTSPRSASRRSKCRVPALLTPNSRRCRRDQGAFLFGFSTSLLGTASRTPIAGTRALKPMPKQGRLVPVVESSPRISNGLRAVVEATASEGLSRTATHRPSVPSFQRLSQGGRRQP